MGSQQTTRRLANGSVEKAGSLSRVVIPIFSENRDVDLHDGHLFVVTERVRGLSLTDYARGNAGPVARGRRTSDRAAAGASIIFMLRGIIHQDLTQSNILIDETGRPRLMDFGSSALPRAAVSVDPNGPTRKLDFRTGITRT